MNNFNITDDAASTLLGKKIDGFDFYNPSVLVCVPRFENRKQYNISPEDLPFLGYDVWHSYEFSVLTNNGIPVTRVLKLRYSADSEFIVESKSLKLYLNSYNMSRFGDSVDECLNICKSMIEKDLSYKLKTDVVVNFLQDDIKPVDIFSDFVDLTTMVDVNNLKISSFKEAPEVLKFVETNNKKANYLKFSSLRSNCRVTHQPDFGDVYIYYYSDKHLCEDSLIEYLVSFRSEYHFHEECCEMIYKRLYDLLNPDDELCVCALYTRRGGIDISPVRYSNSCKFDGYKDLLDITKFARSGIKQ